MFGQAAVALYPFAYCIRESAGVRIQHHVEFARWLTGMKLRKRGDSWVCPKLAYVLRVEGLQPLRYYIQKRRWAVAKAIATRPIL